MVKMIEALFDGTVFHPTEPIALAPNTRVRMTIETVLPAEGKATSFLRTARALNLEGPLTGQRTLTSTCTAGIRPMPTEVFLDTAYAIALSSPNDQFHTRAVALAEQLEATGTRLVTTGPSCWKSGMLSPNSAIVRQRCSSSIPWKWTRR